MCVFIFFVSKERKRLRHLPWPLLRKTIKENTHSFSVSLSPTSIQLLINHKAIDYKIIQLSLLSHLHLFCSAKNVLNPSALFAFITLFSRNGPSRVRHPLSLVNFFMGTTLFEVSTYYIYVNIHPLFFFTILLHLLTLLPA